MTQEYEQRRQTELLERLLHTLGGQAPVSAGTGGGYTSPGAKMNNPREQIKLWNELGPKIKSTQAQFNSLSNQIAFTRNGMRKQAEAAQALDEEMRVLDDLLVKHRRGEIKLTDSVYNEIAARRNSMESSKNFTGNVLKFGEVIGKGIDAYGAYMKASISGVTQVLNAVQSGGSGFAIAGAELERQAMMSTASFQMLGAQAGIASSALGALGPAGQIAGAGLMLMVQYRTMEQQLAVEKFRQASSIMIAGADAVLKSYKTAVAAGAIFTYGADEMTKGLAKAGLTAEQFVEILQKNKEMIVQSGMGMAEGAKYLADMYGRMRKNNVDKALQAIGFNAQGAAEVMGQVMSDMRRADPAFNPRTVAAQHEVEVRTTEYAKNLALISEITGKSAEEQMKESRKLDTNVLFEQLFGNDANRGKFKQALETMGESTQGTVLEMARTGAIYNKEGREAYYSSSNYRNMINELVGAAKNHTLSIEDSMRIQNRYAAGIQEDVRKNPLLAYGKIMGGRFATTGDTLLKTSIDGSKMTAEAVAKSIEAINKQYEEQLKSANDGKNKITNLLLDINKQGEMLVAELQEQVIKKLPEAGKAIIGALREVEAMIKGYTWHGPPGNAGDLLDFIKEEKWKLLGLVFGAAAAQAITSAVTYGISKAWGKITGAPNVEGTTATTANEVSSGEAGNNARRAGNREWRVNPKTGKGTWRSVTAEVPGTAEGAGGTVLESASKAATQNVEKAAANSISEQLAKSAGKWVPVAGYTAMSAFYAKEMYDIEQDLKKGLITEAEARRREITASIATGGGAVSAHIAGGTVGTALTSTGVGAAVAVPATIATSMATGTAVDMGLRYLVSKGMSVVPDSWLESKKKDEKPGTYATQKMSGDVTVSNLPMSSSKTLMVDYGQTTMSGMNSQLYNNFSKALKDNALPTNNNAQTTGVKTAPGALIAQNVNPEIGATDLKRLEEEGKKNSQIFALATMIKQNRDMMQYSANMNIKLDAMVAAMTKGNDLLYDIDSGQKKLVKK